MGQKNCLYGCWKSKKQFVSTQLCHAPHVLEHGERLFCLFNDYEFIKVIVDLAKSDKNDSRFFSHLHKLIDTLTKYFR